VQTAADEAWPVSYRMPHAEARKERERMPRNIGRDDVKRLVADGATLVEVLPHTDFEEVHLPGAINIPLKDLDREATTRLDRNRAVIVYCNDTQ
jgi:rhodanese-related sulfurtransferase